MTKWNREMDLMEIRYRVFISERRTRKNGFYVTVRECIVFGAQIIAMEYDVQ